LREPPTTERRVGDNGDVAYEDIRIGELTIRFLVEGEHSNGSAAIFEVEVPAGARHPLGPGEHVCIKRGEVHGFVNSSGAHAKQLAVVTPAVIGPQFFRDMADVVNVGGPPDPAAIGAVMRRHGLTPAPPPG